MNKWVKKNRLRDGVKIKLKGMLVFIKVKINVILLFFKMVVKVKVKVKLIEKLKSRPQFRDWSWFR